MIRNITNILFVALMFALISACGEDGLNADSVIKESQREENDFDRWIIQKYVTPYNIDFKYRMEDIESDRDYNLVPANYTKSVQMAKLVDFLCLQVYDEVTGSKEFIRSYFPKMIHLVGSPAYRNNNTMVLGTAEGGLKITLYNVNAVKVTDVEELNRFYFKTIHHEFAHILHQTIPYTTDFKEITGSSYVKDSWNTTYSSENESLPKGFISPYASSAPDEDFVELISIYVTSSPEVWAEKMKKAGEGLGLVTAKFEIVYNYMLNSWNIDLNKLRELVLRNESKIGDLDLDKL